MTTGNRSPEDVFGILASEVRVEVLRAFADRRRAAASDPDARPSTPVTLAYSDLMAATGVEDSGRFNYHLQQLLGVFVAETDGGGYRLTWAGQDVVGSILAGTYDGIQREPEPVDAACPVCDDRFVATYESGRLTVACGNDHVAMAVGLPSGAVEGRSTAELVDLAATVQERETAMILDGVCPICYGPVSVGVEELDHPGAVSYQLGGTCERCGHRLRGSLAAPVFGHPAVVAFYEAHGIDVLNARPWEVPYPEGEGAVEALPEGGYEVTLTVEGDSLAVTVGEDGAVREVDRPDAG